LSREEKEAKIKEWVTTQLDKLLKMGSIKTANGLFEEVDFKWIQHVIENNKAALFHDDKVEM